MEYKASTGYCKLICTNKRYSSIAAELCPPNVPEDLPRLMESIGIAVPARQESRNVGALSSLSSLVHDLVLSSISVAALSRQDVEATEPGLRHGPLGRDLAGPRRLLGVEWAAVLGASKSPWGPIAGRPYPIGTLDHACLPFR